MFWTSVSLVIASHIEMIKTFIFAGLRENLCVLERLDIDNLSTSHIP